MLKARSVPPPLLMSAPGSVTAHCFTGTFTFTGSGSDSLFLNPITKPQAMNSGLPANTFGLPHTEV